MVSDVETDGLQRKTAGFSRVAGMRQVLITDPTPSPIPEQARLPVAFPLL